MEHITDAADEAETRHDQHVALLAVDDDETVYLYRTRSTIAALAVAGLVTDAGEDADEHPLTELGAAVARELQTRRDAVEDTPVETDPHTVAAKLTPAQRRAVMDTVRDTGEVIEFSGRPGTKVHTVISLMDRGVFTARENRGRDRDNDEPGTTAHWLTELGWAVRDIVRAEEFGTAEDVPEPATDGKDDGTAEESGTPSALPEHLDHADFTDPGSLTVAAIETAWAAIRAAHPEVPAVAVVTAGGAAYRRQATEVTWGRFHADQWDTSTGTRHELMVSGECLGDGPERVMETLLHEAVHAVAHERGVKETSRQGKYHNKRFVSLATGLGLEWPGGTDPDGTRGFSAVRITDAAKTTFADTMDQLAAGRHMWRSLVLPEPAVDGTADGKEGGTAEESSKPKKLSPNRQPKAECGCGPDRAIWASRRVLRAMTVRCDVCGQQYAVIDNI